MNEATAVQERTLQRGVRRLLSDPSQIWQTATGASFQVLSPGLLNRREGPDFLTVALFIRGEVIIGDAEFHRSSSDWGAHNHSQDPRYANVVLHIVTNDDAPSPKGAETLILGMERVVAALDDVVAQGQNDDGELQHYALLRMLRKTAEFASLLRSRAASDAFSEYSKTFLSSLAKKRRRPAYSEKEFEEIADAISDSYMAMQTIRAFNRESIDFQLEISEVLKRKISVEGKRLRHEIAINCFLPAMLAAANEQLRSQIFLWYWSVKSSNEYSELARRFPNLSQLYFWQQQGMLEYVREHGERGNIASESVLRYGFAEALNLYKRAASPIADDIILLTERAETDAEINDE